jgi:hypothetical protein
LSALVVHGNTNYNALSYIVISYQRVYGDFDQRHEMSNFKSFESSGRVQCVRRFLQQGVDDVGLARRLAAVFSVRHMNIIVTFLPVFDHGARMGLPHVG